MKKTWLTVGHYVSQPTCFCGEEKTFGEVTEYLVRRREATERLGIIAVYMIQNTQEIKNKLINCFHVVRILKKRTSSKICTFCLVLFD